MGGKDKYSQDQGTNLSAEVAGLPFEGETLFVRLWPLKSDKWIYNDHTYMACNIAAAITSPTPGATFGSTTTSFTWNDAGADQYWLEVGTSVGGNDLYSGDQGTDTSATVADLPHGGETVHVRLWSLVSDDWIFNDYVYTASDL